MKDAKKINDHIMKNIFCILIIMLILNACDKNDDTSLGNHNLNRPDIPINDSIDINSDNKIDFVISYKELATNDVQSSGGSIIGSISPIDNNQVLYRSNVGHLFLRVNDTIKKNDNTNSIWGGHTADIVSIMRRSYENWDENWIVLSNLSSDYYLGFKLVIGDSEEIGWFLLDVDTDSGEIIIIYSEISASTELIIKMVD